MRVRYPRQRRAALIGIKRGTTIFRQGADKSGHWKARPISSCAGLILVKARAEKGARVEARAAKRSDAMNRSFARAVEGVLHNLDARHRLFDEIAGPERAPADGTSTSHREWFAQFATDAVMPLFADAVAALEKGGFAARARLVERDAELSAELVIVPPRLGQAAPPPRLTIAAAPHLGALMVEYAGTFPPGAGGLFEGEPRYCDMTYPGNVEQHILRFVVLAIGA
jgi:hypothetical protein